MDNKYVIIGFAVLVLTLLGIATFLIIQRNNDIKELKYDLNSFSEENFKLSTKVASLTEEKSKLAEEIGIFKEFSKGKEFASLVRERLALNYLKSKGLGRKGDSAFKGGPQLPSLDKLYSNTSEEVMDVIRNNCPKEFYLAGAISEEDMQAIEDMKGDYCATEEIKSCPDRVKDSIQKIQSKQEESYAISFYTIYAPDITSGDYKQEAIVYFDDEFNIICSWKFEKEDFYSFIGEPTSID
ncbi:hypothetical protein J4401_01375 [Candidatus Woesearchaeota archaeon]|nr:hypothetical protein [Candidatus Woesearchaeota archaeon]